MFPCGLAIVLHLEAGHSASSDGLYVVGDVALHCTQSRCYAPNNLDSITRVYNSRQVNLLTTLDRISNAALNSAHTPSTEL